MAGHAPAWALIALVSFELAHGGLDNLLAHHRAESGASAWGLRLGAECVLLAVAWRAPQLAAMASVAACTVGAVGLTVAFVQKRRYYLDPPARVAPLSETAPV